MKNRDQGSDVAFIAILLLFTVVVCSAAVIFVRYVRDFRESVSADTALFQTTDMIVEFIASNERFPEGWRDLEDSYRVVDAGYNSFQFAELADVVSVHFDRFNSDDGSFVVEFASGRWTELVREQNQRVRSVARRLPGACRRESDEGSKGPGL